MSAKEACNTQIIISQSLTKQFKTIFCNIRFIMQTLLINAVSVRTGGAETYLNNLLPLITSLLKDWQFKLYIRQSRRNLYRGNLHNTQLIDIPDAAVSSVPKRLCFEHWYMPQKCKENESSLYWQIDEMLSPAVSLIGLPTFAVFHTTPMVMFDDSTGDSRLFRRYAHWLRKSTAMHATTPITVSYHAKAELSGLFPQARERFRVIYHGVDQKHYARRNPTDCPLQRLGIHRPYLLSISNRFVWKNYFRLVQAFHQLINQQPQFPYDLVLIGSSKSHIEEHRIASYIQDNQLNDRIHLVNFIPQSELPNVYLNAQAYIFPSLRETFGMTILEAMACGLPVACGRWGPLPEVAGDAALYFDPVNIQDMANILTTIACDENVRTDLIQRGFEHVRFFTWERAAQQYVRLIEEVCPS